jgi:hypothetical protein
MNESPRPSRYIGETIVAAYYFPVFFQSGQSILSFYLERQVWLDYSFFDPQEMVSIIRAVLCLIVGIGILFRAGWARIAAVLLSAAVVLLYSLTDLAGAISAPWVSSPHPYLRIIPPLQIVLFNAAVVVFFARSLLRDRSATGAA